MNTICFLKTLEKINEKDIFDELSLAFDSFHRFSEGPSKNQVDVYRDSRVKVLGDICDIFLNSVSDSRQYIVSKPILGN